MVSCNQETATIILTGMHRSGTSLTASLLDKAGVNLGENLLGGGRESQGDLKGYFENWDFFEFHRNVLSSVGINQDGWTIENQIKVPEQFVADAKALIEKNKAAPIWGWKDPRTILFLDFWLKIIPDAKFIFLFRSPWEVVDSLYRRGDSIFIKNPNLALETWLNYNQIILDFYKRNPQQCLLFKLEQIIQDHEFLSQSINDKFSLSINLKESSYQESLLDRSVDNSHHPILIKLYFPEVYELYSHLNMLVGNHKKDSRDNESFSTLEHSLHQEWVLQDWSNAKRFENAYKNTQSQLQETQSQLQETQSQLVQCQATIQGMESSKFWKLRQAWFSVKQKLGFLSHET